MSYAPLFKISLFDPSPLLPPLISLESVSSLADAKIMFKPLQSIKASRWHINPYQEEDETVLKAQKRWPGNENGLIKVPK